MHSHKAAANWAITNERRTAALSFEYPTASRLLKN